jgi:hypothetical protein
MIILVAGLALSPSALHCAGVGHWAFADEARFAAEHWKAAATEPDAVGSSDDEAAS